MKADCILHLTHHTMTRTCWGAVLDWALERDITAQQFPNQYAAAYERAVLDSILTRTDTTTR